MKYFPACICKTYNLEVFQHNKFVHVETNKETHGLKQADLLAFEKLSKLLKDATFQPIMGTLNLCKHKIQKTIFFLCVDNFVIKHYNKEFVNHPKNIIEIEHKK